MNRSSRIGWIPWGIVLLLAAPTAVGLPVAAGSAGAPSPGVHVDLGRATGLSHLLAGPAAPRAHTGLQVDPYAYYASEPAPMGIADFGVDPATDVGYTYNTTQFVGTVNISSLSVLNNSNTGSVDQLSLQLNVVLVVSGASGTFTYWIQDVAFLNTTSNLVQFIDNIWNMSASGASTSCSDLYGNGTGCYGWYFAYASSYLPGNDINLAYPATIGLRVVSSIVSGRPSVAFQYNDTGSWVTYDNVAVAFGFGYSTEGFVVDGTQYNAFGLFNDAELILGGPGGGSQTTDVKSHLGLTLEYWNGHNLQPVVNAFNFGSDTAEGINHVVDQGMYLPSDGSLFGYATKGSSKGLATLYDHSFDALVNVSSPLQDGTVLLNGTPVATFIGGDANLTIAPGPYNLELDTTTGSVYANAKIVVPAGAYFPIQFGVAGSYSVQFRETGLPTSTPWSITQGSNLSHSSGTTISFLETNGTYPYSVTPIAGFTTAPWSGNFTVAGSSITVGIAWTRVTYPVNFTETGLPNGTAWRVVVGGAPISGTSGTLGIAEPNGTYAYTVSGISGFVASPSAGYITVAGALRAFTIAWTVAEYDLTFSEQGLPQGTSWSVVVNGTDHVIVGPSFQLPLPNGSYSYHLGLVPGFEALVSNGSAQIDGRAVSVSFQFSISEFPATFTETGLPSGSNWSVTVAGNTAAGNRTNLTLELINGSYLASVSTTAPYAVTLDNVTVAVQGAPAAVTVPFGPLPGWLSGTVSPDDASVSVGGTDVTTAAGAFNLTLPVGEYTVTVQLTAYTPVTQTVTIAPGAGTKVSIALTAIPPTHTKNGTTPVQSPSPAGTPVWEFALLGVVAAAVAIVTVAAIVLRRRRTPPATEQTGPVE